MLVPPETAPQGIRMEYRLLYCPGRVYHASSGFWNRPGTVKIQGRMGGREWADTGESWEVPEGLWRLAPHAEGGMGGGNACC